MSMNLFVGLWAALALCVVALAIYRNLLGIREPGVHVTPTTFPGSNAKREFVKEEKVERWGQWLTVVVVLYGLMLAAMYLYQALEHGKLLNR